MPKSDNFSDKFIALPYLGEFSAGKSVYKSATSHTEINVPAYLNVSHNCFVIKMKGESMQANGLFHNDLLIFSSSITAKNGAIVLATIDNIETVVKNFEQTNDLIILSSKQSDVKPMIFDPSRIKISGFLVSLMRTM